MMSACLDALADSGSETTMGAGVESEEDGQGFALGREVSGAMW